MGNHAMEHWGVWGGHMVMVLGWLALGALVAGFVWFVARRDPNDAGESPEEIVRRRYARGEIDREEYERLLEDLRERR